MNEVIASMQDLLRATQGSTTKIEMTLASDLWTTLCDPQHLEHAIIALLVNAGEATPGGGTVRVETSNARISDALSAIPEPIAPGEYVCIEISDSGAGMTAEEMRDAFEPWFTNGGPTPAAGLGLSMVRRFVRETGGHASIESEADRGATVRLYLPRHPESMSSAGSMR